jgi:hypothetical protein
VKAGLDEKRATISHFFNELRKCLDFREKELLEEYELSFEKETTRAKSYSGLVSQKRASLGDSLTIIKEICNIKDKVIILGQAREVNNLIDISFKSVKHEKLQFAFREFKPDLELKNLLKTQLTSETKQPPLPKTKLGKLTKENQTNKEIENGNEELGRVVLKPSPESPKSTVTSGTLVAQDQTVANQPASRAKASSVAMSGANHSGMARSLVTRDKNKVTEPSRDKSSRKEAKVGALVGKDKRKENMPPKFCSQTITQASPTPTSKGSQKINKKYGTKLEDIRQKTVTTGGQVKREQSEEELLKISLTASQADDRDDMEPASNLYPTEDPIPHSVASNSEMTASQPSITKKISELDKARALKKAASKGSNTGLHNAKLSTPTKGESQREQVLIGSWSKSINKKALVDRDQSGLSDNTSMRLTDMKPRLLPETESPTFMIIGNPL